MKSHFIIDRSKWRTGDNSTYQTGKGVTALKNDKGYMCCLGFVCLQSGVKEDLILNMGEPEEVQKEIPYLTNTLKDVEGDIFYGNTNLSTEAMDINDDPYTTPVEKENKLKELFEKHKLSIEFVGEYE